MRIFRRKKKEAVVLTLTEDIFLPTLRSLYGINELSEEDRILLGEQVLSAIAKSGALLSATMNFADTAYRKTLSRPDQPEMDNNELMINTFETLSVAYPDQKDFMQRAQRMCQIGMVLPYLNEKEKSSGD